MVVVQLRDCAITLSLASIAISNSAALSSLVHLVLGLSVYPDLMNV